MAVHKSGPPLPSKVQFPPGKTTLSFKAFADETTTVDVEYTIVAPGGVTFANGTSKETLNGFAVGLDDTVVPKAVQFTAAGQPVQVPIHVQGRARGASGGSFGLTWVIPVKITSAGVTTLGVAAGGPAGADADVERAFSTELLLCRVCELLESVAEDIRPAAAPAAALKSAVRKTGARRGASTRSTPKKSARGKRTRGR